MQVQLRQLGEKPQYLFFLYFFAPPLCIVALFNVFKISMRNGRNARIPC
jgi:hypothetical protein